MTNDSIYSLLGICMKAGKLVSGEFATEQCINSGKARLVIVSSDASDNTKKKFTDKCKYHNAPIRIFGTKEHIGNATGKTDRTSIAITDSGLAKTLKDKLLSYEQDGGDTNGKN